MSEEDSHIAEVYRNFPMPSEHSKLALEFKRHADRLPELSSTHSVGVIALGAGTGSRELKVCQQLLANQQLEHLDILVTDMSSELVVVALKAFKKVLSNKRATHQFAVLDIESDTGIEHLRTLRTQGEKFGHQPFVFLLLGNTLGVIDEKQFLARMSTVMLPQDIILCEVSLASDKDTENPGTQKEDYKPEDDRERAQFICDPLRALGINPKISNLKQESVREQRRWVRHEFYYQFDASEAQMDLSITPKIKIVKDSRVGLTELKRMTKTHALEVFEEVFSEVRITEHEYDAVSPGAAKVRMAYVFASNPGSSPRIKFHDSDLKNLCFEMGGVKCKLHPTHYAFVRFLESDYTTASSEMARSFVIDWLQKFAERGGDLGEGGKSFLARMIAARDRTDPDEKPFEAISNLKSQAHTALENIKGEGQPAALKLLAIWPGNRDWKLKK
ncbi:MAG: hypothetical protein ABL974_06000 [Prosthecobacter sp.]